MNSKTFFNILLKVVGIFLLKDAIFGVITTMTAFATSIDLFDADFFIVLLISLAYVVFPFLFIFKTEEISKLLRLTNNIEQEIPLNVHRSTVLTIAVIVFGGVLLVDAIPAFIGQVWEYYKMKRQEELFQYRPDMKYIIMHGVKIIIGLLLLGNARPIVNYIEYRRKKKAQR